MSLAFDQTRRDVATVGRAQWMRAARWGVFCHFLADTAGQMTGASLSVDAWNRRVEAFDVEALARQLAEVGAGYFVLTLGQNSGFYCAPNATYDALVGRTPSRLSGRDLVADLSAALQPHGIKTLAYLPSHAPAHDALAVQALRCTPPWDAGAWSFTEQSYSPQQGAQTDARLSEFHQNWEAVMREWSLRWGERVAGWWIDGCYFVDRLYRGDDAPNLRSFAAALRAGNLRSIVALNQGVSGVLAAPTEEDDYTPGEADFALPVPGDRGDGPIHCGPMMGGAQYHVLSFLGRWWGDYVPRFDAEFARAYTRSVVEAGGVMTWDVPVNERGLIPDDFLRQLRLLSPSR